MSRRSAKMIYNRVSCAQFRWSTKRHVSWSNGQFIASQKSLWLVIMRPSRMRGRKQLNVFLPRACFAAAFDAAIAKWNLRKCYLRWEGLFILMRATTRFPDTFFALIFCSAEFCIPIRRTDTLMIMSGFRRLIPAALLRRKNVTDFFLSSFAACCTFKLAYDFVSLCRQSVAVLFSYQKHRQPRWNWSFCIN